MVTRRSPLARPGRVHIRSTAGRAPSPDCSIRFLGCSRSRRTGHIGERSHTAGLADRQKHRDGHWHLGDALCRDGGIPLAHSRRYNWPTVGCVAAVWTLSTDCGAACPKPMPWSNCGCCNKARAMLSWLWGEDRRLKFAISLCRHICQYTRRSRHIDGGKWANIFSTDFSRSFMALSGLSGRVSLAEPRQINFLLLVSNMSMTRVPTS
jgi:hypothetical protein